MSQRLNQLPIAIYLLLLMLGIQVFQTLTGGSLMTLGIYPRSFSGLIGILTGPFIHHGWLHLLHNAIPFAILGSIVQYKKDSTLFWEVTVVVGLVAGLGTWLFGSQAYHVGASAILLGYWSFILTDGWLKRSFKSIALAMLVLALYGGFIFIIFDFRSHISWSGHVFGLIGGAIAAKFNR